MHEAMSVISVYRQFSFHENFKIGIEEETYCISSIDVKVLCFIVI